MLKIQEHIIQHGLEETIAKFKLNLKDLGHKVMLKYDQIESSNKYIEVQEARGLVLEKGTWWIMSMPFTRFYTHDDFYAAKLDLTNTVFTEKRDGTLIQVYWDYVTETWSINTMFSECEDKFFNREITLKEVFLDLMKKYDSSFDLFEKGFTYIFELTSPYNKVVVRYSEPELRLIGVKKLDTLEEYNFWLMNLVSRYIKIPLIEEYKFYSIEECLDSFQGKSFNFEGYVAFDGDNRIKIKNPAYVAVHLTKRMKDELLDITNPYIFLDIVKQNEIAEFTTSFPHASELIVDLQNRYNALIKKLHKAKEQIGTITDKKELSIKIQSVILENGIKPDLNSVFFMLNNGKIKSIEEYLQKCDNKKLIKLI